jgi:hypothetical protein
MNGTGAWVGAVGRIHFDVGRPGELLRVTSFLIFLFWGEN